MATVGKTVGRQWAIQLSVPGQIPMALDRGVRACFEADGRASCAVAWCFRHGRGVFSTGFPVWLWSPVGNPPVARVRWLAGHLVNAPKGLKVTEDF